MIAVSLEMSDEPQFSAIWGDPKVCGYVINTVSSRE